MILVHPQIRLYKMNKCYSLFCFLFLFLLNERSNAQLKKDMNLKVVLPGADYGEAPSDAIMLFDGQDLRHWVSSKDTTAVAPWKVKNGIMTVKPGTGPIQTKQS